MRKVKKKRRWSLRERLGAPTNWTGEKRDTKLMSRIRCRPQGGHSDQKQMFQNRKISSNRCVVINLTNILTLKREREKNQHSFFIELYWVIVFFKRFYIRRIFQLCKSAGTIIDELYRLTLSLLCASRLSVSLFFLIPHLFGELILFPFRCILSWLYRHT